ncbi:MAG: ABC transporter permease [Candidatus Nanopelagicales bacterium]
MDTPLTTEEAAALARRTGLHRVDKAGEFSAYLRDCWRLRHFTGNYAISRTIVDTVQNRLGLFWQLLNPLFLSGIYYFAFGFILGTSKDSPDFLVFLVSGVFTWQLFASVMQSGSLVLATTKDLTESLLFPRILLPIAVALQETLSALGSALVLYPIALLYGMRPTWAWLLLPFTFLLTSLFGFGVSLFTARWVEKIYDLRQFVPLILRAMMFVSGVFYDVTVRFHKAPHLVRTLANFNPASILLKLTRAVFIPGQLPAPHELIFIGVITATLIICGTVAFWRSERGHG